MSEIARLGGVLNCISWTIRPPMNPPRGGLMRRKVVVAPFAFPIKLDDRFSHHLEIGPILLSPDGQQVFHAANAGRIIRAIRASLCAPRHRTLAFAGYDAAAQCLLHGEVELR